MRILTTSGRRTTGAVALTLGLLAAGAAAAHHGWGSYDADNPLTLTGLLTEVAFEQPHVHVRVEAEGRAWTVILGPISRVESRGATQDVLKVGTTISAYGYPSRTEPNEMRAERITVGDRTYEMR
jgi:hypothetical protein